MRWAHTMYRVSDLDESIGFYETLGFKESRRVPIKDEAIIVFLSIGDSDEILELTYNHGVSSYEVGTGYGHIALVVDDLEKTLSELEGQGILPEKPPYRVDRSLLCFVNDPDGYRIELIEEVN